MIDLSAAVQRKIAGKGQEARTQMTSRAVQGVTTKKMYGRLASGDTFFKGRDLDDHN